MSQYRSIFDLRDHLVRQQRKGRSLHEIARSDFPKPVAPGTLSRIANDRRYEPKRIDVRLNLGLPPLYQVAACSKCGQVHVSKRCTGKLPRAPRPEPTPIQRWWRRLTKQERDRLITSLYKEIIE